MRNATERLLCDFHFVGRMVRFRTTKCINMCFSASESIRRAGSQVAYETSPYRLYRVVVCGHRLRDSRNYCVFVVFFFVFSSVFREINIRRQHTHSHTHTLTCRTNAPPCIVVCITFRLFIQIHCDRTSRNSVAAQLFRFPLCQMKLPTLRSAASTSTVCSAHEILIYVFRMRNSPDWENGVSHRDSNPRADITHEQPNEKNTRKSLWVSVCVCVREWVSAGRALWLHIYLSTFNSNLIRTPHDLGHIPEGDGIPTHWRLRGFFVRYTTSLTFHTAHTQGHTHVTHARNGAFLSKSKQLCTIV